jgi:hypothetical protein
MLVAWDPDETAARKVTGEEMWRVQVELLVCMSRSKQLRAEDDEDRGWKGQSGHLESGLVLLGDYWCV